MRSSVVETQKPNKQEQQMNDYLHPKWDEAGRVHDWRNHVPEHIIEKWDDLSDEIKHDLYLWAEQLSSDEHWN